MIEETKEDNVFRRLDESEIDISWLSQAAKETKEDVRNKVKDSYIDMVLTLDSFSKELDKLIVLAAYTGDQQIYNDVYELRDKLK